MAAQYAFIVFMLFSFGWDIATRTLPNWLCAGGITAALFFQTAGRGWIGLKEGVMGAAVGFGLLLVLYVAKAVAGGDVKWFCAAGAFTGGETVTILLVVSIILSGVYAVLLCAGSRRFRARCWEVMMLVTVALRTGSGPVLATLGDADREWRRFPFMASVLPGGLIVYAGNLLFGVPGGW
jgi:prepilin peptidase CpaA